MSATRVAAVVILLVGCRDPSRPEPEPLGARLSVWVPDQSAVLAHERISPSYSWHVVARDSASWRRLWEQAFHGWQPIPPRPSVEFDSSMVIMAVAAETDEVRLDSLVTHELGTRVFITKCWQLRPFGDPFQEPPGWAEFVRTPRMTLAATSTTVLQGCW
jgi:DNA-binding transcriptional LysR family regulator